MPSHVNKGQRKMDPTKPQAVTIQLNPRQIEIVNRLYEGGLHGNSCAEVVRRLFSDGCLPHANEPKI